MNPRFRSVGERILLTLWVGGMWAVGFVAVPTLFSVLDDRHLAGTLAGHILTAMSYMGFACGGLLLIIALARTGSGWLRSPRVWTLAVMLAIIVVGEYVLAPTIIELRGTGLVKGTAEAAQFARIHGIASTLFLINSLLGLGLVAFGSGDGWERGGRKDANGAKES